MPSYSGVWSLEAQYQAQGLGNWPIPPIVARGLFSGGYSGNYVSAITYVQIATTGDSTSFGNLSSALQYTTACASSTRGVIIGGYGTFSEVNVMQYVTISTTGNTTYFGKPYSTAGGANSLGAACNSSTRGLMTGGYGNYNTIGYITIATTGDAQFFGNIGASSDLYEKQASCSSSTRGLFAGGTDVNTGTNTNRIMYSTIATLGNATTFGTLSRVTTSLAACSSSTRGVFAGGLNSGAAQNTVDYVTIATTGNATSFGTLTAQRRALAGCSSALRGVFAGGADSGGSLQSNIDYITIATVSYTHLRAHETG
jgi:hypothetical protein